MLNYLKEITENNTSRATELGSDFFSRTICHFAPTVYVWGKRKEQQNGAIPLTLTGILPDNQYRPDQNQIVLIYELAETPFHKAGGVYVHMDFRPSQEAYQVSLTEFPRHYLVSQITRYKRREDGGMDTPDDQLDYHELAVSHGRFERSAGDFKLKADSDDETHDSKTEYVNWQKSNDPFLCGTYEYASSLHFEVPDMIFGMLWSQYYYGISDEMREAYDDEDQQIKNAVTFARSVGLTPVIPPDKKIADAPPF